MRFQGIIFDLNGVLWLDSDLQESAWRQFSLATRGTPLSRDEVAVHVHGRYNRHTLEYLVGRPLQEGEADRFAQQKEAIYRQLCLDQGHGFRLAEGAVELLQFLVAHQIPRTIATAAGQGNLDFFRKHLHLDRWFDPARIVYDDGTLPGKPAPDLYLQAAANLDLAPARCVVVEDADSGLQAARAAGIGYLIALGPAHTHARLAHVGGVDCVVESLAQVPRERLFLD